MSSAIYIHFPFCKSKCNYCSFFSDTNQNNLNLFYKNLHEKIEQSKDFFDKDNPTTLYFGGGTPSLMSLKEIEKVISFYSLRYTLEEITLELNPGDITDSLLRNLKDIGVNRVSIGVQSFDNDILTYLGRRHSVEEVYTNLKLVEKYFKNYSIDQIIGLPGYKYNFEKLRDFLLIFKPTHLSVYGLSIEEGTTFYRDNVEIDGEDFSIEYLEMSSFLQRSGFTHYEISNFALDKYESKHNSKYWDRSNYIGIGPSAHSMWNNRRFFFDENFYSHTLSDIFISGDVESEEEIIMEYVMLSLRTSRGVEIGYVKNLHKLHTMIEENFVKLVEDKIYFTALGWTLFDSVYVELF